MKINAAPRILIVAGLCAAALVGMVIAEGNARAGGLEAVLPMEAVDPRALLSGHYVQINLTQQLEPGVECPPGGETSKWIALRQDGDIYRLTGGADSREGALQHGPVPVRGSFFCSAAVAAPDQPPVPGWITLRLGVDRFHINQTDALRIEQVLREQRADEATRAFAIVSIGRDGRARLRGLMIDGERLELTWL